MTSKDNVKDEVLRRLALGFRPEQLSFLLQQTPLDVKKLIAPAKVPSPRESRALEMYNAGVSFYDIGDAMGCSPATAMAVIGICRNVKQLPVPYRVPLRARHKK